MTSGIRIAFIGQRGVPAGEGGIERHVEELGARLAARGHEVTVYCRRNYLSDRPAMHRGMRLRHLPTISTKSLDFIAHTALSTLLAMPGRPDIIHYHAIGSALVAPLPRVASRSGIVLTVHGLDQDRAKWNGPGRVMLRVAAGLSASVPHATITVSQALADHYRDRYGREATYIPNGAPAAERRSPSRMAERLGLREGRYFLFVGRLVPEKRPDLLVRAFRRLPGDIRLVIAGSSGFTDGYAASVAALAAADPRVVMAGGVYGEDLAELYSNAAAFVLPSSLEGLPITLLEAAAHSAPVIVSDIPPHVEVVGTDGPGSHLVASGDETALTAAMAAALADPEAERLGADALRRRVVQRYSWEVAAASTELIYEAVLARHTAPATSSQTSIQ
jgi:glycosyltransferase involved in cell wall biosynthesis